MIVAPAPVLVANLRLWPESCLHSLGTIGGPIPTGLGPDAPTGVITSIDRLVDRGGRLVGYVYHSNREVAMVQIKHSMSAADAKKIGLQRPVNDVSDSNVRPFMRNPWNDIAIVPCTHADMRPPRTLR